MLLTFDKAARPVLLEGVDSAPPAFVSVFRFWPWWSMPEDATADPLIRVTPDRDAFWVEAPWLDERLRYNDAVNLACGLAVHVNHAMLLDRPDLICLHGAGIEIDGRLVVFPNAYRAGKSLLTACLAAAGARVFSDDILPIDRNSRQGIAIGVSPRLRLPLPETTGERTRRFIEQHSGAMNAQYLYVELDERRQAPLGEQSPFAGFVLLERRDGSPATLEPVSDGETLKQLVLRNFARQIPAADSLEFLHGLVASGACYKLTYSVGDEAADVLMARFKDRSALARDVEAKASTDMFACSMDMKPVEGGDHIRRSPGIGERLVGDGLFLTDQTGESVYHLNLVGAGVWRLLDGYCSLNDAKSLLHQAFPGVAVDQVDRDTDRLVQDLVDQGLLIQPEKALVG
jgi:hypothetical protein